MKSNKFCWYGGIGAVITSLCCFTPLLVIGLTLGGATAIIGYLDYILLPLLAFFVGLTGYGLYRARQEKKDGEAKRHPTTERNS